MDGIPSNTAKRKPHMTALWWTLIILLIVVGLVGTVVPLLPGTTLILAGAVIHKLVFPEGAHSVSWWVIGGMIVLMIVSYAIDFISGAVGAKYFGATRWGAVGGLIGAVVGIFFSLPGIFIGPLVGVLVGELIGGKQLVDAGKSTWGTLLGTTAGMIAKLIIALVMVCLFVLDVWF
jgi:uncharacterized protein YqgC (DUF456 family)